MMLDILRIVLGLFLVIFLPGYLLSLILFSRLKAIERICLSVGLSFTIVVFLGFFLTIMGTTLNLKAINTLSVWISMLAISVILLIIVFLRSKNVYRQDYPGDSD